MVLQIQLLLKLAVGSLDLAVDLPIQGSGGEGNNQIFKQFVYRASRALVKMRLFNYNKANHRHHIPVQIIYLHHLIWDQKLEKGLLSRVKIIRDQKVGGNVYWQE